MRSTIDGSGQTCRSQRQVSAGALWFLRGSLAAGLLLALPAPVHTLPGLAVALPLSPAQAPLQPAGHAAPPLQGVPLGQRLRVEQECGQCHRLEDRRHPRAPRGEAVMT